MLNSKTKTMELLQKANVTPFEEGVTHIGLTMGRPVGLMSNIKANGNAINVTKYPTKRDPSEFYYGLSDAKSGVRFANKDGYPQGRFLILTLETKPGERFSKETFVFQTREELNQIINLKEVVENMGLESNKPAFKQLFELGWINLEQSA